MKRRFLILATLLTVQFAHGAEPPLGQLIADLTGPMPRDRAVARQLLVRQGPRAVPELIPLLAHADGLASKAAFDVLYEIGNHAAAPGFAADRKQVTDQLMTLLAPANKDEEKIIGLRLLERLVAPGDDVAPVAALLEGKEPLRDKARTALERMATPESLEALSIAVDTAEPAFQAALLDSLASAHHAGSLARMQNLCDAVDPQVRVACARGLAWTGDPAYLPYVRRVIEMADEQTKFAATDAMLRLAESMALAGGKWQIAIDTYLEVLKTATGVQKDAALAGLGRFGDGSCVAPILAAMNDGPERTYLVGIGALRSLQGVDVARALVEHYPKASSRLQLALLPILGDRKHPLVLPILFEAAKSGDEPTRSAALAALGQSDQPEAAAVLMDAIKTGPEAMRPTARGALVALADALKAGGRTKEAAKIYKEAFSVQEDVSWRNWALVGMTACPSPEACDIASTALAIKELRVVATRALVSAANALKAAGKKEEAKAAYRKVLDATPPADLIPAVARSLAELGVKLDLASLMGVIDAWQVLGPFPLGENQVNWTKPLFEEAQVDLKATYPGAKAPVGWKKLVSSDPSGKIDLRKHLADTDEAVAYAYAEIELTKDAEALLQIGADDSERVWVNGRQVFELTAARGLSCDQDKIPVQLKAGRNTILLKIWQLNQGWEFCVRLTTADGAPLAFRLVTP